MSMRVFLDANVLLSASNEDSAIHELLAWLRQSHVVVTSDLAIEEARRNLALKRPAWQPAFDVLVRGVEVVPSIVFALPVELQDKDVPLLCAAIRGRCERFVTGDRRDFGHVMGKTIQGVKIVSPLDLAKELAATE